MSRDLQKYRRQTTVRLIIGGILLLFIVGTGLIYLIYGQTAAMSGFVCLAIGMIPLAAILIFFWVIDWIIKRSHDA
jgi:hypothetical protein